MNLQTLIERYVAFRKSLGEVQRSGAAVLRMFGRFIGEGADIADVRAGRVDAFLAAAGSTRTWHTKFGVLRQFYRYAVSRGHVAATPLPTVIPKRPPPFVPYIFSPDDLRRLLQAADTNPRRQLCLDPLTVRTILLLLYGAGLRVREAVDLDRGDVDLADSLLTVRQTKFGKTRLVPVGPPLALALARYAERAAIPGPGAPFFTTRAGGRVNVGTLQNHFRFLRRHAGVARSDGASYQPRIHDLRHNAASRIMPTVFAR